MFKKFSALLISLLACSVINSWAQPGELLINSSGQGNCANPYWSTLYSGTSGPVYITVQGLYCGQTGSTSPIVIRQLTNSVCNSGGLGNGNAGYNFVGSICGTWAVYKNAGSSSSSSSSPAPSTSSSSSSAACPHPGQVYQSNVPVSQMNTVMPVANTYCIGSSGNSACGAAATPYNYSGYGSPTAFTVYCR